MKETTLVHQSMRQAYNAGPCLKNSTATAREGAKMKKATLIVFLFTALTGTIWAACSGNVKCPMHDVSTVTFAGDQKFENGHFWYLYHCSGDDKKGHYFWVRCD